ncbi:DMT family transporter [Nocardia sp. alder85J]|uniref:DMT family transporter n=1 Tax=Nocardia sp. alder85J TaxID=2862949 RepID=UPI001CD77D75|nr:EamA family transporter [Nocardia sp. alder85J]MCX4093263.1 EamA family transporter [Nocardia sp. alder85J]
MFVDVVARSRDRSAPVLMVAGILWGTGGLAGARLGAQAHLQPVAVACLRLLLGGGCAVAYLAVSGGLRGLPRTPAALRRVLLTGVLLGQFQGCYFAAVHYVSVSLATMVTIGAMPVFVTLGTLARTRRRPGGRTVAALSAALSGLVLLTWSPGVAVTGAGLAAGLGLSLACALGFATLTLLTATPVAGLAPLPTTAFGMVLGGAVLVPIAAVSGLSLSFHPATLATALYLGTVPTALAYTLYFRGLRTAAPIFASLAALLEPLTAAVLSAVLLGDRLTPLGWCGAALLTATVGLSARGDRSGSHAGTDPIPPHAG